MRIQTLSMYSHPQIGRANALHRATRSQIVLLDLMHGTPELAATSFLRVTLVAGLLGLAWRGTYSKLHNRLPFAGIEPWVSNDCSYIFLPPKGDVFNSNPSIPAEPWY